MNGQRCLHPRENNTTFSKLSVKFRGEDLEIRVSDNDPDLAYLEWHVTKVKNKERCFTCMHVLSLKK